jgi:hypothetical protein
MEQILIYKPNGDYEPINSNSLVSAITQAEHKKVLLGEDVINMTVTSASVRNFAIGDYIKVLGLPRYKINQLPRVTKIAERKYEYELIFEGLQYDLLRVAYRNTDTSSFNNAGDFSLIGNLEMFLIVLINNLNRVFGTDKWALGDFPAGTETRNLLFNNENCLAVLQRLSEEYKFQFVIAETETQCILHMRETGSDLDYNFRYGQGKGLYQLVRENVDSKNIVNTLWAYGSNKNLPATYKNYSPRLRLGLGEDLPQLELTSIALYGIFEGSVIFDEIYPHRTGTVSAINTSDRLQFIDTSMDFDLNARSGDNSLYLIDGNVAKVVFQTGNLAGYEFEIEKYVHTSKTFTIKPNKDSKGFDLPSVTETAFQIVVGDTYVIVDIMMPQSYINAAEQELEAKVLEYLDNYSVPTVKYSLELDEFYIRDTAESLNVFEVGDTVNIEDEDLGINARIKIIEYTRNILRPYKYALVIRDMPQNNLFRKFLVQTNYIRDFMKFKGLDDPVRANSDWRSDKQILSEIPRHLNESKDLPIGNKSEKVTLGNNDSWMKVLGTFGIENPIGKRADFDVQGLTMDRQVAFPDKDIVVNDWDYIVGLPESFPSLTSDYGLIGLQDGINKVFNTSASFVAGSTIVYINGVRQFRGATGDYMETGDNEISFVLAPYIDDSVIVDFQKK